jgi:hypothetical protein
MKAAWYYQISEKVSSHYYFYTIELWICNIATAKMRTAKSAATR